MKNTGSINSSNLNNSKEKEIFKNQNIHISSNNQQKIMQIQKSSFTSEIMDDNSDINRNINIGYSSFVNSNKENSNDIKSQSTIGSNNSIIKITNKDNVQSCYLQEIVGNSKDDLERN